MNNIKFKKSLMAAAAGALLATVGMSAANANSLLFPYFTTANGAQSYLSLATGPNATGNNNIHYVFGYFDSANASTVSYTTAGGNTYTAPNVCGHFDVRGTMTANDLIQQALFNGPTAISGPDLFGGTASTAGYMPLNAQGYLIVTDTSAPNTSAGDLTGSMIVFDPSSGMVSSYKGIFGAAGAPATNEGNFSNITDTSFRLTWYPYNIATTSWYYVVAGNENSAINSARPWQGGALLSNGNYVYNRDEQQVSGSINGLAACAGQLTLNPANAAAGVTALLSAPQYNALGNGGIINLSASGLTGNGDVGTGLILAKVETTNALGPKTTLVTIENNVASNRSNQN